MTGLKMRPSKGLSRIQERNRRRIMEAALTEFSRLGYSGTTIEMIAKTAGMSKSNLLYYFSSKTAIYEAVLADILDIWLAPLRGLEVDNDPAEELADYIRQKLQMSADFPFQSRLFANEILQGAPRIKQILENELKMLVEEKSKVIRKWIEYGKIGSVEPVHLIFAIWAMTQHYSDFAPQIEALTGKGLSDPGFRKDAESMILQMVLSAVGLNASKGKESGS